MNTDNENLIGFGYSFGTTWCIRSNSGYKLIAEIYKKGEIVWNVSKAERTQYKTIYERARIYKKELNALKRDYDATAEKLMSMQGARTKESLILAHNLSVLRESIRVIEDMSVCRTTENDYYKRKAVAYCEKYGIQSYRIDDNMLIYNSNVKNLNCIGEKARTIQKVINLDTFEEVSHKVLKRLQKDGWDNV